MGTRRTSLILIVAFVSSAGAQSPPVARVVVTPAAPEVTVGQPLQLKAQAVDSSGRVVPNVTIRFQRAVGIFEGGVDQDGVVLQRMIGRGETRRSVLVRSPEMEALVIAETAKLVEDWEGNARVYDGLIYFMGWREDDRFIPLYIGKTETLGRGKGNLSANLKRLIRDRSKFARWGDNYAYHIGDLSACVLPGHPPSKARLEPQCAQGDARPRACPPRSAASAPL